MNPLYQKIRALDALREQLKEKGETFRTALPLNEDNRSLFSEYISLAAQFHGIPANSPGWGTAREALIAENERVNRMPSTCSVPTLNREETCFYEEQFV